MFIYKYSVNNHVIIHSFYLIILFVCINIIEHHVCVYKYNWAQCYIYNSKHCFYIDTLKSCFYILKPHSYPQMWGFMVCNLVEHVGESLGSLGGPCFGHELGLNGGVI